MCNGDYVFCATRSGDIVKLYVDLLAENGSKSASIVATAVKKAPSKSGMNAGKFTGGTNYVDQIRSYLKLIKKAEKINISKVNVLKQNCHKYKKRIVKRLCQEL